MKPAAFDYRAAETLEQALALKQQQGDEARWLAGGQSLLPAMNLRLARPAMLIDINPLAELDRLDETASGALSIGASRADPASIRFSAASSTRSRRTSAGRRRSA